MDCPTCGYMMSEFDTDCPRCARLKAKGRDPIRANATASPEEASAPALKKQVASYTRETVKSMKPEFMFHMDEPELGWPLTGLLWFVLVLNALALIGAFVLPLPAGTALGLFIFSIPRIVGVIGMLRTMIWGFKLFALVSVAPALLSLMMGGVNWISLVITIAPAIAIFILALGKWDHFE